MLAWLDTFPTSWPLTRTQRALFSTKETAASTDDVTMLHTVDIWRALSEKNACTSIVHDVKKTKIKPGAVMSAYLKSVLRKEEDAFRADQGF